MKSLFATLTLAGALLLGGCNHSAETTTTAAEAPATTEQPAAAPVDNTVIATPADTTAAPAAANAAYICPMKCKGSESATPGKCPVCGMDLVKNG